jgi:hypothetical protein
VELRIEGTDLPAGLPGRVRVGVQRRGRPGELLDPRSADDPSVTWLLDCAVAEKPGGPDITGPYVQGGPGGRFVYLSWTVDEGGTPTMFRRAKLMFDAIPPAVLTAAVHSGRLVARLGLTDPKGGPLCASVRPPVITWSAG